MQEEHSAEPSQGLSGIEAQIQDYGRPLSSERSATWVPSPSEPAQPRPMFFVKACTQFTGVVFSPVFSTMETPVTFKVVGVGRGGTPFLMCGKGGGREFLRRQ